MSWVARHPQLRVVVTDQLPADEMGGWAAENDTIYLAANLTVSEQRSTLAHELVHRMFGDRGSHPDRDERERRCRFVTAKLLLPLAVLRDVLPAHMAAAAAALGVDTETLVDCLRGLAEHDLADVLT